MHTKILSEKLEGRNQLGNPGVHAKIQLEQTEPTQPPIQWVPESLIPGVKWLGREADHSPPFRAQVKNAWRYTSAHQYVFMTWCLIKPWMSS
jgi:hypothetical protein